MKRRIHLLVPAIAGGLLVTGLFAVDPGSPAGRSAPTSDAIDATPLIADLGGRDAESFSGINVFLIDRFQVYDVDDVGANIPVMLEDQFDEEGAQPFTLDVIDRFSTVVQKSKEVPLDPDAHLVWYKFLAPSKQPPRYLRMENQFGLKQIVRIQSPAYLLVPAGKGAGAPSVGLDHYKCYDVSHAVSVDENVILQDQFGIEGVTVRKAKYVCTPVAKSVCSGGDNNGDSCIEPGDCPGGACVGGAINNEEDHLVFYEIDPQTALAAEITANDQFGEHVLNVTQALYLGVPSKKILLNIPAVSEWGLATLLVLVLIAATIALRRRTALA